MLNALPSALRHVLPAWDRSEPTNLLSLTPRNLRLAWHLRFDLRHGGDLAAALPPHLRETARDTLTALRVIGPAESLPANASREVERRHRLHQRLYVRKACLRLRSRDDADQIFANLLDEAPWLQGPIQALWQAALDGIGGPLILPPLLLVGPPGGGKTRFAMRLVETLGLPASRIEAAGSTAVFDISGSEFQWRDAMPGEPIRLVERSGHATVALIVDEVDKVARGSNAGDLALALLPLLQSETARGFRCPYFQMPVDLSRISWILTANDLRAVPAPLRDRCRVFAVTLPEGAMLRCMVERQLAGFAEPEIISEVARGIEEGRLSLRGLARIAMDLRRLARRPRLH